MLLAVIALAAVTVFALAQLPQAAAVLPVVLVAALLLRLWVGRRADDR
jgi:membrane protein implicated in regulation of membrane protease activity